MSLNTFGLCRVQQQIPLLPLKAAEERWASSALFSCAVQLHNNNLPQSAETLFAAACDAAASSLCKVVHDGSQAAQVTMTMLHAPQAATGCFSSNAYACSLPKPLHVVNTSPRHCLCRRFALLSWSHLHLLASAACKTACNRSSPNSTDVTFLQPEMQAQMQSFVRKNQALVNALHQQGRTPAALKALRNALTLLASLGMAFIRCGQPLVLALVTLRAGLQSGPLLQAASKPGSR